MYLYVCMYVQVAFKEKTGVLTKKDNANKRMHSMYRKRYGDILSGRQRTNKKQKPNKPKERFRNGIKEGF